MTDNNEATEDHEKKSIEATISSAQDALRLVHGRNRRMQLTKGARFEASRRHKFSGRSSGYSIVILSVWIFALSVFVLIYPENRSNTYLNAVNLILSFFVIAFSLLQGAKRHELRSEMFLKCAQEIDEISTDLNLEEGRSRYLISIEGAKFPPDQEAIKAHIIDMYKYVEKFDTRYQKVLMSFSDNHSDMDYNIYSFKSHRNPKGKTGLKWLTLTLESMYWRTVNFWYVRNTMILAVFLPIISLGFRESFVSFFAGSPIPK